MPFEPLELATFEDEFLLGTDGEFVLNDENVAPCCCVGADVCVCTCGRLELIASQTTPVITLEFSILMPTPCYIGSPNPITGTMEIDEEVIPGFEGCRGFRAAPFTIADFSASLVMRVLCNGNTVSLLFEDPTPSSNCSFGAVTNLTINCDGCFTATFTVEIIDVSGAPIPACPCEGLFATITITEPGGCP